jgi:hypothetical protein
MAVYSASETVALAGSRCQQAPALDFACRSPRFGARVARVGQDEAISYPREHILERSRLPRDRAGSWLHQRSFGKCGISPLGEIVGTL